jgi:hypothetical protein
MDDCNSTIYFYLQLYAQFWGAILIAKCNSQLLMGNNALWQLVGELEAEGNQS